MTILKDLDRFDIKVDYKSLCELICMSKPVDAINIYLEKTKGILEQNSTVIYRLALNNLNYSIFYYLLYMYDADLTNICYSNTLLMHTRVDEENFKKIVENIVFSYYSEMLDMKIVTKNPMIQQVLQYVEEHLSEQILISDLAKIVHVNSTYLSQLFKNTMGQSFTSYLTQHRIHHAKILLLSTDKNIDAISIESGFSSPSYFSTVFTNKTGISPGKYRKNHQMNSGHGMEHGVKHG